MATTTKTPVMVLQELSTKKKWPPPEFQIISSISGTHVNRFDFVVDLPVVGVTGRGSGSSKQIGKHEAAHNALMQLQELGIYNPSENPVAKFDVPVDDENSHFKATINCIMDLQNLCIENKIPAPRFQEISSVGPPHAREFAWECTVASIRTEAKANTKKMAKQLAAKEMLERINDVLPELAAQTRELTNALTDSDAKAIKIYTSEFSKNVIPDKSSRVDEMPAIFTKLMEEKGLKYDDFKQLFEEVSEENLREILNKLDLSYELTLIQDFPPIVTIELNTERPFCAAAMDVSKEKAEFKAIAQAFLILECFINRPPKIATESNGSETVEELEIQKTLLET